MNMNEAALVRVGELEAENAALRAKLTAAEKERDEIHHGYRVVAQSREEWKENWSKATLRAELAEAKKECRDCIGPGVLVCAVCHKCEEHCGHHEQHGCGCENDPVEAAGDPGYKEPFTCDLHTQIQERDGEVCFLADRCKSLEKQLSEATAALSGRTVLSEEAILNAVHTLIILPAHDKEEGRDRHSCDFAVDVLRRLTNGDEKS